MRAMLLACGLLLAASPALAQRTDLPPADRVNEALDNHPSVAAAAARVEAARARGDKEAQRLDVTARRVRADRVADPSFGVRLFSERGGTETGAGVVASISLGGGYRRAAADQASAEANAARMELAAVTRTVEAMANAGLSNARTRFNAWSNAEASARSAGDAAARTARGYQLGQIDLADLLYAQRQTNDARRMEIDARSEANRALLRLEIDSHSIWAAVDRE